MKIFNELDTENVELFAFYNYRNPNCAGIEEFREDLARFKYLKKLVNRHLESADLQARLILNHLIVIFNVFEPQAVHRILKFKMTELQLTVIKPFVEFLGYIGYNDFCNITPNPEASESVRDL